MTHEGGETLEHTATWAVAAVCGVIVAISLIVQKLLHSIGQHFLKSERAPLYQALQKIKEELMVMGFMSLLVTVLEAWTERICIPKVWSDTWLPCSRDESQLHTVTHIFRFQRLLSQSSKPSNPNTADYCTSKGKVSLLSGTALHHLHIFIFVLAFVHVVFCALTLILGSAKIRKWKKWEESALSMELDEVLKINVTNIEDIKKRFGSGYMFAWLHSFWRQFSGSVTKSDYLTLRLGFIRNHCPEDPKFDFHKYMMCCLERDFKKVVGVRWYLWLFVLLFLLINVQGWHLYFYLEFIPLVLLMAIGSKLEHVIMELAAEVAQENVAFEGDSDYSVVQPSDDYFWFGRPKFVLYLIHMLLVENSFGFAFYLFISLQYSNDSCILKEEEYIIPRLVIETAVRFLCSYSTLPLYALVTQMGSSFKKEILEENPPKRLHKAKSKRRDYRRFLRNSGYRRTSPLPLLPAQDANNGKLQRTERTSRVRNEDDNDGLVSPRGSEDGKCERREESVTSLRHDESMSILYPFSRFELGKIELMEKL